MTAKVKHNGGWPQASVLLTLYDADIHSKQLDSRNLSRPSLKVVCTWPQCTFHVKGIYWCVLRWWNAACMQFNSVLQTWLHHQYESDGYVCRLLYVLLYACLLSTLMSYVWWDEIPPKHMSSNPPQSITFNLWQPVDISLLHSSLFFHLVLNYNPQQASLGTRVMLTWVTVGWHGLL